MRVVAIVPFPNGGGDEILVLPASDSVSLPADELRGGERLLDAATRIVLEQAGFHPIAERILYLLEGREPILTIGVLCSLPSDAGDAVDLRGEFVSLSRFDGTLEPSALREILLEDARSGFVRPVAHIVETRDEGLQITW